MLLMSQAEQVMWIRQVRNYGIGNTVTMMPGLRELSVRLGKRLPMYFETEGLSQLFADAPFLDVMPVKLTYHPAFTSMKPDRQPGESDYMAWMRICTSGMPHPEPVPYVDECDPPRWWKHPKGKTIAIIHGCLSEFQKSIQRKDVGAEVRQRMVDAVCEAGATPVIIGTSQDSFNFWNKLDVFRKDVEFCALGNPDISLRRAVGIMQKCDAFISNATGLAHVGAASGMTGLVLWKDCDFEKNVMPSPNVHHLNTVASETTKEISDAIGRFAKGVLA